MQSLTRDVMTGCRDTLLQEAVCAVHCAAAAFTSVQLEEKHMYIFRALLLAAHVEMMFYFSVSHSHIQS